MASEWRDDERIGMTTAASEDLGRPESRHDVGGANARPFADQCQSSTRRRMRARRGQAVIGILSGRAAMGCGASLVALKRAVARAEDGTGAPGGAGGAAGRGAVRRWSQPALRGESGGFDD
jgi:hypothetical protein